MVESLLRRVATSALWAAAGRWGLALVSIASMVIMARLLGPVIYGRVTLALIIVGVGGLIAAGPLADFAMQHEALTPRQTHATFWLTGALGLLVALGLTVFANWGPRSISAILPWLGVSVAFNGLAATPFALLIREMRFKALAALDLGAGLAASLTGVVMAKLGFGVYSLVGMELVRSVYRCAGAFLCARYRPGPPPPLVVYGPIVRFGLGGLGLSALSYLDLRIPQMAIGAILGPQALGLYGLASRMLDTLEGVLLGPLADVTFSAVARAQSDGALLRRLILNIMRFASTVATPAFIGLSALAPVIVPVVFGPKWLAATAAVQILLLVGIRTAAAGFSLSILRGLGHVRTPLIAMAVGVCLSAMLAPALTRFGITFTALAVLVRFLLTWPLASYFLKMATGLSIREQARASAPAQLASALMGVTVALAIRPMAQVLSPWWTIVLGVTLGLVAYGALAAAFDRQGLALVVTEISKRLGINSRKLGPGLQS